jgi:tetratricopeptide (TPR) repeat protein
MTTYGFQSNHKLDNRLDKDIDDYTKAIELNPNEASAYIRRGVAYEAKRDYNNAIADFTTAINMRDNVGYLYRGSAYQEKREYDRAIADLSKFIEMNPNASLAYWGRGQVYICMREYGKAIGFAY